MVFSAENIEVPQQYSQVATDILAQKYFRKAGVAAKLKRVEENDVPSWLWRSAPDTKALEKLPEEERFGGETSAKQVFNRLVGTWTYWAWKANYFSSEEDAKTYYDEMSPCWPVRWLPQTPHNGLTQDCTGPTVLMDPVRATFT